MRRGEQDLAPVAEHRTEVRLGRLRAETEEGEAGRLQDHPADGRRHGDDDDRQDVGQDLAEQDAGVALAGEPRGVDEFAPRETDGDAADVAGEEGYVDDGDRVERVEQARPEHRDDTQGQQDVGKRHHHVDAAHHDVIGASAGVSGHQPDERAEEGRDDRRRHADRQRDAAAPDEAREDVATERVGAKEMAAGEWQHQPVDRGGDVGVGQWQNRRGERDQNDDRQDDEPAGRQRVVEEQPDRVGTTRHHGFRRRSGGDIDHQRSLGSRIVWTTSAARLNST